MTRPLTALLALALLAGAVTAQFKPAKTAAEVKARLATIVEFKGIDEKVRIADVLELMNARYGLKIELRTAALVKAGIEKPDQVELMLPPMSASLDRVLRKAIASLKVGATLAVVGGTIQISTEEELRSRRIQPTSPPNLKARQTTTAAAIKKTVNFAGIDDPKATIAEALQLLKARYKVQIDLRDEAFAYYGVREVGRVTIDKPIPAMKAPLAKVIDTLIGKIQVEGDRPVALIGSDGTVVITTQKIGEKPVGPAPAS